MNDNKSFWNFLTGIFSASKTKTTQFRRNSSLTGNDVIPKEAVVCSTSSSNDSNHKMAKKQFKSLKRHETCSVDLSDKTLRLQSPYQFKSMERPHLLHRTNSIDLSRDFPDDLQPIGDFEHLNVLGEGAFGRAIKVKHTKTGRYFVLKEVLSHTKENEESIIREMSVLRSLKHENVLTCRGLVLKEKRICLLTELMEGGSLQARIQDRSQPINTHTKVSFLLNIAAGMDYLHRNSVMHRDLTSSNCLLRKNNSVVVCDFGLSKLLTSLQLSKASLVRPSNYMRCASSTETINELSKATAVSHSNSNLATDDNPGNLGVRRNRNFLSVTDITRLVDSPGDNSRPGSPQFSASSVNRAQTDSKFSPFDDITDYQSKRKTSNLRRKHTVVGSAFWMAPEMLAGRSYNSQVDLYSFGIIGCEITARVSSHPEQLDRRTRDMSLNFDLFLRKNRDSELADCPEPLLELIRVCCDTEPDNRPGFDVILCWLEDAMFRMTNNMSPKPYQNNTDPMVDYEDE